MAGDILCVIDLSEGSKDALRWAVALARRLGSHVTILYAYRLNDGSHEAVALKRRIEHDARIHFTTLEGDILKDQGISYDFTIEVGFVADRVALHAKTRRLAFLVIDSSIGTSNRELLDEAVSEIHVPLVIVPQRKPTFA